MTKQKTFKRRVRERMEKTGESYVAARSQLLEPPTRVQETTGRRIEAWFALLDAGGAAEMTHTQIARVLVGEHGVPGWWAQHITVEYERARGRRAVNQNARGEFYAGVSKTIAAPAADVFAELEASLSDWGLVRRPTRARLVLRADAEVGRVALSVEDKGERCTVAVQHEKLPDAAAVLQAKAVWRERLSALAA